MKRTNAYLVALPILALAGAGCQPQAANVTVSPNSPYGTEGLTVTGKAVIREAPDLAVLRVGCSFSSSTGQGARRRTQDTIDGVIAALRKAGAEAKDIQTSSFTLGQQYDYDRKVRYWRSSTMLEVRTKNVSKAGALLDAALDAGANEVRDVDFTIEAMEQARNKAREEACRVAKSKAEQYAKSLGADLGSIVAIREDLGGPNPWRYRSANAQVAMDAPSGAGTDQGAVSSGSVGVELTVEVVYSLKR